MAAITPQIETAEIAKSARVRPGDLGAYELALRAWAEGRDAYIKSDIALRDRAIETARQALAADPQCSLAHISVSLAQYQHFVFGTAADRRLAWAEGVAASTRAIEIDASNHVAFALRGLLYYYGSQRRLGIDDLRHAHQQNPNDATTLQSLAMVEAMFGDAPKGVEYSTMALRLSPRDYFRASMLHVLAFSHFLARQYEQGMEAALAATREAPGFSSGHTSLALNLIGLKKVDQAMAAVQTVRRIAPASLNTRLAEGYPLERQEDFERTTTFLRIAAGLEDPSAAEALR